MYYIDRLLNQAIWLLLEKNNKNELRYISRIETERTAWYFWLAGAAGVYEFRLKDCYEENGLEKSTFMLKYYPDPNEDTFEDFSCSEQIIRMSSYFDNSIIEIDKEEHDSCPCCAGGHHVHEHGKECKTNLVKRRSKGIPKLLKRSLLQPSLFLIGEVEFDMKQDMLLNSAFVTQTEFIQFSEEGLYAGQDDQVYELVGKGEVDRKVKGLNLCRAFYDFLVETLFGAISIKLIGEQTYSTIGSVSYQRKDGSYYNRRADDVKKVEVHNCYKIGGAG
ncbi:MAG: hypothetical protein GX451_05650 [Acholeplasmataceae bacterium]|nr:hypothetical protein [Acholeplasmataceae bacterium]